MTSENYGGQTAADPFTKFWTDMMSKMGSSGATPPFGVSQEEVSRQMRQACFDAWAKYCEDFMRSDAFLDAMKKSMDGALAFRQQVNDFLKKAVGDSPLASSDDTETIVLAVRSLEERVLDRSLVEDVVARDELAADLLQLDHVTEFNVFACFAALEQLRVLLEDAEQLLFVRHTLTFEDTPSRLVHDLLAQHDEVIDLLDNGRGLGSLQDAVKSLALSQCLANGPCPPEQVLDHPNQLHIQGL